MVNVAEEKPDDYVIATGKQYGAQRIPRHAVANKLDMKLFWEGTGINEVGRDENGKIIIKVSPNISGNNGSRKSVR